MSDEPERASVPPETSLEAVLEESRRLAVLNEVARIATEGTDLSASLSAITALLSETFGWEFVACVSIDHERGRFRCEAVTSRVPTEVRPGYGRPLGSGVVGLVAARGEPILLDDVRTYPDYVETLPGALSELCVPVRHRGEVIAVLNLESTREAAFHDQLPLLENVARQVAGAIHLAQTNDRLLEANRRLSQANRRLEAAQRKIVRLTESGASALANPGAWARAVCAEVASSLGGAEVSLWELDRGVLLPLSGEDAARPAADLVRRSGAGRLVADGAGGWAASAAGLSGELCGAVLVRGLAREPDEVEEGLVLGLAHQLAGVLETRRMRERLARAEADRARAGGAGRGAAQETAAVCPACGRCFPLPSGPCEEDGTPLDGSRPVPLRVDGRYRLERHLGEGGMGTVFAARDERLEREVAVKLIRAEHFENADVRRRFEAEARAVARIRHPGVVALFDSGQLPDGSAYLVLERLSGRDLGTVLARHGAGTPRQVAALLAQAGAALAAAHRSGIVHRDVKPENVFLVDAPAGLRAKLVDFGLAKSLGADARLTRTGTIVGTPAYMSPEQVQGLPVDARSDLYSLAALAYEALTGRRAVPGADVARTLANVLDLAPQPLSESLPVATEELDRAFARALEKDPHRRPLSVEAWAREVAALLTDLPPLGPGWPDPPG